MFALSAEAQKNKSETIESLITRFEQEEVDALLRNDLAAVRAHWAPDYVVNNPFGRVVNASEGPISAGALTYSVFERKIERIVVQKDVVIVMGSERVVPKPPSADAGKTINRRFTNFWMRRSGKWLLTARHASVISIDELNVATEEKRNEMVIRQHHAAINAGDITGAAAFYADTVVNNGNKVDRARILSIMQDNSRTFPDWKMTIDRLIARGDQVVVLMTVTGTHKAVSQRPVNGGVYLGVPPTGKAFSVLHTHWFVLKNGLIVEHRATRDDLGLSRQLGLLPPAPPRPPN